jgi:hypothetical protein
MTQENIMQLTTPSDREITMTRTFDISDYALTITFKYTIGPREAELLSLRREAASTHQ